MEYISAGKKISQLWNTKMCFSKHDLKHTALKDALGKCIQISFNKELPIALSSGRLIIEGSFTGSPPCLPNLHTESSEK